MSDQLAQEIQTIADEMRAAKAGHKIVAQGNVLLVPVKPEHRALAIEMLHLISGGASTITYDEKNSRAVMAYDYPGTTKEDRQIAMASFFTSLESQENIDGLASGIAIARAYQDKLAACVEGKLAEPARYSVTQANQICAASTPMLLQELNQPTK